MRVRGSTIEFGRHRGLRAETLHEGTRVVRDGGVIPLLDGSRELEQSGAKVGSGGGHATEGVVDGQWHGLSPVGFRDAERYRRNKIHGVQSWQADFNRTIASARRRTDPLKEPGLTGLSSRAVSRDQGPSIHSSHYTGQ